MEEFRKHGVRAVKMDDIASRLGISKRTLYEIYSNKETLLLEGMKMYEEDIDAYMTRFVESDEHNVIETIIEFYNLQIKQSANINPLYFEELHRYPSVLAFLSRSTRTAA